MNNARVNFAKRGESLIQNKNGDRNSINHGRNDPFYYPPSENDIMAAKESLSLLKSKMGSFKVGETVNQIKRYNKPETYNSKLKNETNQNYTSINPNLEKTNITNSRRTQMTRIEKETPNLNKNDNYRKKINVDNNEHDYKNDYENVKKTENRVKENVVYNKNRDLNKNTIDKLFDPSKKNQNDENKKIEIKDPNIFEKIAKMNNAEVPNEELEDLVICSEGCGRKFKISVVSKHEQNCKKVFQSKRKAYDIMAKRLTNEKGEAIVNLKEVKQKLEKKKNNNSSKTNKIPKWKIESHMLRKGLGKIGKDAIKNEDLDLDQHIKETTTITCPHCNRNFNNESGKRHIPFCADKAKSKALTINSQKKKETTNVKNTLSSKPIAKPNLKLIK